MDPIILYIAFIYLTINIVYTKIGIRNTHSYWRFWSYMAFELTKRGWS